MYKMNSPLSRALFGGKPALHSSAINPFPGEKDFALLPRTQNSKSNGDRIAARNAEEKSGARAGPCQGRARQARAGAGLAGPGKRSGTPGQRAILKFLDLNLDFFQKIFRFREESTRAANSEEARADGAKSAFGRRSEKCFQAKNFRQPKGNLEKFKMDFLDDNAKKIGKPFTKGLSEQENAINGAEISFSEQDWFSKADADVEAKEFALSVQSEAENRDSEFYSPLVLDFGGEGRELILRGAEGESRPLYKGRPNAKQNAMFQICGRPRSRRRRACAPLGTRCFEEVSAALTPVYRVSTDGIKRPRRQ